MTNNEEMIEAVFDAIAKSHPDLPVNFWVSVCEICADLGIPIPKESKPND